jgi:hypothetical protein
VFHACGEQAYSPNSAGVSFPSWHLQAADKYGVQIRCS